MGVEMSETENGYESFPTLMLQKLKGCSNSDSMRGVGDQKMSMKPTDVPNFSPCLIPDPEQEWTISTWESILKSSAPTRTSRLSIGMTAFGPTMSAIPVG